MGEQAFFDIRSFEAFCIIYPIKAVKHRLLTRIKELLPYLFHLPNPHDTRSRGLCRLWGNSIERKDPAHKKTSIFYDNNFQQKHFLSAWVGRVFGMMKHLVLADGMGGKEN